MKPHVFIVALLATLLLDTHAIFAQPTTAPAVCTYKETRGEKTPINPKTKKPYTPNQRNQEPFDGGSITKDEIKKCLQAKVPIKNHHIVFEDYRDAWQELAKETGDYAIPLLIRGGVLYSTEDDKGGIRFGEFRDPSVNDSSKLTEVKRRAFSIERKNVPINLIRSTVKCIGIYINGETDFRGSNFSGEINFRHSNFSRGVSFIGSTFNRKVDFRRSTFAGRAGFIMSTFVGEASFGGSNFNGGAGFIFSSFNVEANFSGANFSGKITFVGANFSGKTTFVGANFDGKSDFEMSTFFKEANFGGSDFFGEADFRDSTFFGKASFQNARFRDNADLRRMLIQAMLIFDDTTWEKRADFRGMSAKELSWDSTKSPSNVQGTIDMREAYIGSAKIQEVRFQDLVDISRTNFGRFRIDSEKLFDDLEIMNNDFMDLLSTDTFIVPSAQVQLENNTFENDADFLNVKFNAPTVFINNRFRRTLNLNGATFVDQNSPVQNFPFCLSYNRINRSNSRSALKILYDLCRRVSPRAI
jgi:uncharacterized protein YjbI with pentapeptide repeats